MSAVIHESITEERVCEAVEQSMLELENIGLCLNCGAEHGECEPDARNYICESCRCPDVFGAQEILIAEYFAGKPKTIVDRSS